eukprot:TCONS_00033146-protein
MHCFKMIDIFYILLIFDLTLSTSLDDFKKGARFRLPRTQRAPLGFEIQRDNQKPDKCEIINECSTNNDFQLQPQKGRQMKSADDVQFLFYSPGSVSYCQDTSKWTISGEFIGCLMTVFEKGVGHVDTSELVDELCKDTMSKKSGTYFSPNNPGSKSDYANVETLSNRNDGAKIYVFGLVSGSGDFYSLFTKVSKESKGFWEWEVL